MSVHLVLKSVVISVVLGSSSAHVLAEEDSYQVELEESHAQFHNDCKDHPAQDACVANLKIQFYIAFCCKTF